MGTDEDSDEVTWIAPRDAAALVAPAAGSDHHPVALEWRLERTVTGKLLWSFELGGERRARLQGVHSERRG